LLLQDRECLGEGMAGIQVQNRLPLRTSALRWRLPLLNDEESMGHKVIEAGLRISVKDY
jgi:hypothetical protein